MAAIVRKNSISFLSGNLCKTHVSIFFSTSTKCKITRNIVSPYSELLIHKYQFSPQIASKVASVISTLKNPKNAESILSFLKETGFSNSQLEKIIRTKSQILASSPKIIKPKIQIFQDLGFSGGDVIQMVATDPSILRSSLNNSIIPTLSALKYLLGSNDRVVRLLTKPAWNLFENIEKHMLPNIELLKSCGIAMEQILRHMFTFPCFFTINPEHMRRSIEKADELGADKTSKLFIHAVRVVSSMSKETWELKLKTFRDLGFSEDDVLRVFRSAPMVLTVSEEKIKKVKEILLETGKYDTSCIVNCPNSLSFSVKKRYKPRLQVLRDLEKRNKIKKWPSLGTLCSQPDKKFFKRYNDPNTKEFSGAIIAKNVVSSEREMQHVQKDVKFLKY